MAGHFFVRLHAVWLYLFAMILSASPTSVRQALHRAVALHQQGQIEKAARIYGEIIRVAPNCAEAHDLLGVTKSLRGLHDDAIAHMRKAQALNHKLPGPKINLPQALLKARRFDEAIVLFRRRLKEDPADERAAVGLAQALLGADRDEEAISAMEAASARFQHSAGFLNERGRLASKLGTNKVAVEDYRQALRLEPNFHAAALNLANALVELRKFDEAKSAFELALRLQPRNLSATIGIASLYRMQQHAQKAMAVARSGLEQFPGEPGLMTLIGRALIDLGHNDEAEQILRQVIAGGAGADVALAALAPIHKFRLGDPVIAQAEKMLADSKGGDKLEERKALYFVKSKIHDDIGDYGKAVAAAIEAKTINPLRNLIADSTAFVRQFLDGTGAAFFASRRLLGSPTDQPVFIIGMPRSGTTLTEQIIASHGMADGAGELTKIPDFRKSLGIFEDRFAPEHIKPADLEQPRIADMAEEFLTALRANRKPDALRITDKLPHNFQNVWLIALLFPNARIIHCKRNAVDVCMSIFLRNFGDGHWYTRDLATLGKFYKLYEEQVAHWKSVCGLKWYDNDYEKLVADPEPNIRAMIDFLGLPWDEKCLSHTKTERSVMTFSRWQVRQPIYQSSVEKWRRYAPYIGPLLKELGVAAT